MASYAESLLADGEVVLMRQRQHPLTIVFDGRAGIALWIIAIVLLFALVFFNIGEGTARTVLSWGALVAIVAGLAIFAWNWWHWRTEEYLVTNRRLLKVSGIVNKESADSSLEKINDAILHQDLFARMLDYGDLEIMTAAEVSVDHYRMLHHAKAFKIEMLNAKHTLEHEVAYVTMPSPPLRSGDSTGGAGSSSTGGAGSSGSAAGASAPAAAPAWSSTPAAAPAATDTGVAAAPAPSAAIPAAAPSTPAVDTTEEVTETLARLADLRDRGAITAADYEAKKSELLGRL